MNNTVVIKGMQSGLKIVLDSNIPYDELRQNIIEKFSQSSDFLGKADVAVIFEGRELKNDELLDIIGIIHDTTMLNIVCVLDNDPIREEEFHRSIENKLLEFTENTAIFHKGTIRSGQSLDVSAGVVILGDVQADATVNASGNVIVAGSIEGVVNAGINDNKRAFVMALDMHPSQIKIADYTYRAELSNLHRKKSLLSKKKNIPMVAYVELGKINITEITQEIIHDLRIK